MYIEVGNRLIPSHKQMQNVSNSMTGKAMYWVLFGEAHMLYKYIQNF
jgi:hypothetical protein